MFRRKINNTLHCSVSSSSNLRVVKHTFVGVCPMRVGYTDVCCSEAGSVPLVLARFDWLSKKTHCVVTKSFISATLASIRK